MQVRQESFAPISIDDPFMASYNPSILGVSMPNKTNIFIKSGTAGGMITPDLVLDPGYNMKGKDAYERSVATIADSLEVEQTQDLLRHHLAAAMTGYIPPEGVPINQGLWYQRNYLRNLNQPGLYAVPRSYAELAQAGM